MHELGFVGKFGSRGRSLMLNTFSFGAWNLEIFEVEVWKNLTYQNISKCQAICLNIPSCLTFYMSFKWEKCLYKSCSSLKYLQNGHQLDIIWIYNEWVMHFWSWGKSLVQWYWSKMTYNVSSYHMLIKVELDLPPNIKVELDALNWIVQLVNLSSHKNWASYGLRKLAFKLGFRQNDL